MNIKELEKPNSDNNFVGQMYDLGITNKKVGGTRKRKFNKRNTKKSKKQTR